MSVTHLLRVTTGYGDFAETALIRTDSDSASANLKQATRIVGGNAAELLVIEDFDAATADVAVYRDFNGWKRSNDTDNIVRALDYVRDPLVESFGSGSAAYFDMIWDGASERITF